MSRVTDFPEDESRPLKDRAEGGESERTLRMPKLSPVRRIAEFYQGVKLEMRKTTWPTRNDVWSTTVVVLIAVFFFGFYLWGADQVITVGFRYLEKVVR